MKNKCPHFPTLLVFDMHGGFIFFSETEGQYTVRTKTLITDDTIVTCLEHGVELLSEILSEVELTNDGVISSAKGKMTSLHRTGAMRLKEIYHVKARYDPKLKAVLPVIAEL